MRKAKSIGHKNYSIIRKDDFIGQLIKYQSSLYNVDSFVQNTLPVIRQFNKRGLFDLVCISAPMLFSLIVKNEIMAEGLQNQHAFGYFRYYMASSIAARYIQSYLLDVIDYYQRKVGILNVKNESGNDISFWESYVCERFAAIHRRSAISGFFANVSFVDINSPHRGLFMKIIEKTLKYSVGYVDNSFDFGIDLGKVLSIHSLAKYYDYLVLICM